MKIMHIINKLCGGNKNNIIKVIFSVENKNFECYVPDDAYWGILKEMFLNREYEYLPEFELKNFKEGIIVDCGAHVGIFSLVVSVFAKKVISIEPHPVNYRLLEINKIINNCSNIITINKALCGKKIPKIKIYNGNHSEGHSILENFTDKYYEVSTITLEEIVNTYGNIDLLEIDIEGAEFDVFINTSIKSLKKINAIVGEIHLKYGDINKIIHRLKDAEFEVSYFYLPLIKKNNKNSVKLKLYNCVRLKILRKLIYTVTSLGNIKDKNLAILFAKKIE